MNNFTTFAKKYLMAKKYIYRGIAMLILLAAIIACEKDTLPFNLAPTVTTGNAEGIYRNGALSIAGCVYNPNVSIVEEYGIEYSLYQSFAESVKVKAENKDSIGNFTVAIENLQPGVSYFYRTYVFGGYNTIYGEVSSFTTASTNVPQFDSLTVVSNVSFTSFDVKADLIDDGGAEGGVQTRAFLYIPAEMRWKNFLEQHQMSL